jgi:hypothetical protein
MCTPWGPQDRVWDPTIKTIRLGAPALYPGWGLVIPHSRSPNRATGYWHPIFLFFFSLALNRLNWAVEEEALFTVGCRRTQCIHMDRRPATLYLAHWEWGISSWNSQTHNKRPSQCYTEWELCNRFYMCVVLHVCVLVCMGVREIALVYKGWFTSCCFLC